jgi:hypothetical protein
VLVVSGPSCFVSTRSFARAAFIAATLASCIFALPAACADNAAAQVTMPLNLQTEQGSEFFSWFHLAPVGTPTTVGGSQAWHGFRPTGSAFQALVEVDVLSEADGKIEAASLGLDRSFIDDPRNAVFARDIAKSFLAWAIRKPSPQISALIANLADLSSAGGTIIMRGPAPQPPPPDTTGGYRVYLGREPRASFAGDDTRLAFANFPGTLPTERMFDAGGDQGSKPAGGSGWLRIDVRFSANEQAP